MVCLASRTCGGYYRNLGRETYLVPFIWENGWPVINPGKGILEDTVVSPNLPSGSVDRVPSREDFDSTDFPMNFLFLRNPREDYYSLENRPGFLEIRLAPDTLSSRGTPSYVCRRQQAFDFLAETSVSFVPKSENEQAGIAIYQSQSFNYQFLIGKRGKKSKVSLVKTYQDEVETIAEALLDRDYQDIHLRITEQGQELSFTYSTDGRLYRTLADHVDARMLSTDVAGGFVGNTIGLYATSNGRPSTTTAAFDYFTCK